MKGKLIYALYGDTHPGHLLRYFVNRRYMKRYAKLSNAMILEIGSARGVFAFWLSRNRNYTVDALDIDTSHVKECNEIKEKINRVNVCFTCADASQKLPWEAKYDIIFSSHVLEHINDDVMVLINAYKCLKSGGFFILQIPYGDPEKLPSNEELANGHVREGYTESNIRRKLEHAGFEVVTAVGGIGKFGRFGYKLGKRTSQLRVGFNLATLLFPVTLFFVCLEQIAASLRMHEPSFMHGPVVLARKPL
ncbi:MAG: methyltransferase domain-containing protein [Candidatus Scalindua sp.]